MTRYLKINPHVSSYKVDPYSPEEIDAQDNAGRIWATIMAIKMEAQQAVRDAYDRGYADGKFDRGTKGS